MVYLKLQDDGGITIGSKHYQNPDELKREKDNAQIAFIKKAVTEKDSMLLVWLSDIYGDNLASTDAFNNLNIPEQFFVLGLLPFLSYKEFNGYSWDALQYLIDSCPGRSDLFEIYAAQGLPLTGQGCGYKKAPIDYVVCSFNELSRKHGTDTINNLIRLLCKLEADVNEYSGDGTFSLINAYNAKDNALIKLLLELGADENQYREYLYNQLILAKNRASTENEYQNLAKEFLGMNGYKDTRALANDCENQFRILKERREKQEHIERERRAKQEEKERKEKRALEARLKTEEMFIKIKRYIPVFFAILAVIFLFSLFKSGDEGTVLNGILGTLFFIVPFLFIYFLGWDHPVIRIIVLIINIWITTIIYNVASDEIESNTVLFAMFAIYVICNLISCITAMIPSINRDW